MVSKREHCLWILALGSPLNKPVVWVYCYLVTVWSAGENTGLYPRRGLLISKAARRTVIKTHRSHSQKIFHLSELQHTKIMSKSCQKTYHWEPQQLWIARLENHRISMKKFMKTINLKNQKLLTPINSASKDPDQVWIRTCKLTNWFLLQCFILNSCCTVYSSLCVVALYAESISNIPAYGESYLSRGSSPWVHPAFPYLALCVHQLMEAGKGEVLGWELPVRRNREGSTYILCIFPLQKYLFDTVNSRVFDICYT